MNKLISIVVVVNDAQESDISIPLSSINNQLGIDFSKIEIVLVDNGRYRLEYPERLELFANLNINYIQTDDAMPWADALQYGIDQAQGTYVMVMGANGQLDKLNVLQDLIVQIEVNPDAEVISGLVIDQEIDRRRQQSFQVGRDDRSVRGTLMKVEFLRSNGLRLDTQFGEYGEEYFCRMVSSLATQTIRLDDIVYARFMSRNLAPEVLAPVTNLINEKWIEMMEAWLKHVKEIDHQRFLDGFARFIVQFYSKVQHVALQKRAPYTELIGQYVSQNAEAWEYTKGFIQDLRNSDHNPDAPWNKNLVGFEAYLKQINQSN